MYKNNSNADSDISPGSRQPAGIEEIIFAVEELYRNRAELKKILFHIHSRLYFCFNITNINGKTAADILQDVIVKFLEGERKWYKTENENFRCVLYLTIKSYIYNELKKKEKDIVTGSDIFEKEECDLDSLPDCTSPAEVTDKIFESNNDDISVLLLKIFPYDRDSFKAALLMTEYPQNNKKIACELNMSVNEVEALKKRIKRKIVNYIKKNRNSC